MADVQPLPGSLLDSFPQDALEVEASSSSLDARTFDVGIADSAGSNYHAVADSFQQEEALNARGSLLGQLRKSSSKILGEAKEAQSTETVSTDTIDAQSDQNASAIATQPANSSHMESKAMESLEKLSALKRELRKANEEKKQLALQIENLTVSQPPAPSDETMKELAELQQEKITLLASQQALRDELSTCQQLVDSLRNELSHEGENNAELKSTLKKETEVHEQARNVWLESRSKLQQDIDEKIENFRVVCVELARVQSLHKNQPEINEQTPTLVTLSEPENSEVIKEETLQQPPSSSDATTSTTLLVTSEPSVGNLDTESVDIVLPSEQQDDRTISAIAMAHLKPLPPSLKSSFDNLIKLVNDRQPLDATQIPLPLSVALSKASLQELRPVISALLSEQERIIQPINLVNITGNMYMGSGKLNRSTEVEEQESFKLLSEANVLIQQQQEENSLQVNQSTPVNENNVSINSQNIVSERVEKEINTDDLNSKDLVKLEPLYHQLKELQDENDTLLAYVRVLIGRILDCENAHIVLKSPLMVSTV